MQQFLKHVALTLPLLAAILPHSTALAQHRPRIGIGVGAGTVLGSRLFDHEFTLPVEGTTLHFAREVDLEDVAVLSAHGEWYVTPHIALRGHAAWGGGRLQVRTAEDTDGTTERSFESDFGDVQVTAYDAGIGIWPWGPSTVGFAPFITAGVGNFIYDFDAVTADGLFRAEGRRSARAWLIGIGADMNVWRSISVRFEAINHVIDSPLEATDFDAVVGPVATDAFGESVNNIRLVLGAQIYLPFQEYSPSTEP